jgi:hypothetical protein
MFERWAGGIPERFARFVEEVTKPTQDGSGRSIPRVKHGE